MFHIFVAKNILINLNTKFVYLFRHRQGTRGCDSILPRNRSNFRQIQLLIVLGHLQIPQTGQEKGDARPLDIQ